MITPATELLEVNILPTPYRILGQDLLPFSVGHAFLFAKLGITAIATAEDLIMAVLVCCHTYGELEERLNKRSWRWSWRFKRWRKQCRKILKSEARYIAASTKLTEYMDEGTAQPDYDITSTARGDTSDSKTPFLQHLRTVLMAKLNYKPSEVMNMAYSQAIWDYRSYMEIEGAIVVTDGRPGENTAALFENAEERIQEAIRLHNERNKRN